MRIPVSITFFRRTLLFALALLAVLCLNQPVRAQGISVSIQPGAATPGVLPGVPGVNYPLNQNYSLLIGASSVSIPLARLEIYSYELINGSYTPTNGGNPVGTHTLSGVNLTGAHTFVVVNQAYGSYWWQGGAADIQGNHAVTDLYGPFNTP